jgi:hypothetical protein
MFRETEVGIASFFLDPDELAYKAGDGINTEHAGEPRYRARFRHDKRGR